MSRAWIDRQPDPTPEMWERWLHKEQDRREALYGGVDEIDARLSAWQRQLDSDEPIDPEQVKELRRYAHQLLLEDDRQRDSATGANSGKQEVTDAT